MTTSAHQFSHQAMATSCGVVVVGDDREYAAYAARAAFDELDRVERELSRFVADSDVSRINSLAGGQWLRIGPEAWECLALARQAWELTGGAFDVTLGAGMQLIDMDPAAHAVAAREAGVQVDLGGIGKGYAVDAMVTLLRSDWRIECGLVHAGQSTVFAWGRATGSRQASEWIASDDHCWPVQLRDPRDESRSVGTIVLSSRAFSGSGVGRHGPHIVDPRGSACRAGRGRADMGATSEPGHLLDSASSGRGGVRWVAAWAVAPTAAEADALSTAFMVMDTIEVERVCGQRPDAAGMLLTDSPGAEPIVFGDVGLRSSA